MHFLIHFLAVLSSRFGVRTRQTGSKGAGSLNPNRQIDLGCLLNPFVFALALMKELLGREHIRLCMCVCLCMCVKERETEQEQ